MSSFSSNRSVALLYGLDVHHLDHVGPLAALLKIPLVVTEEKVKTLAGKYYPNLFVKYQSPLEVGEYITQNYDALFSSLPTGLVDQILFLPEALLQKRVTRIWCPHGNSDKGYASYFMEGLKKEKIALVYGRKMVDFLREKHVYKQLNQVIPIGNFRSFFYQKNASFYDALVKKEILSSFPQKAPILFYAPTWQDAEASSSFFDAFPPLVETLPPHWNLMVKLHPNLSRKEPQRVETLLEKGRKKKNVKVVEEFTPIYPLLSAATVYLGDMSSIGYDFLTFKRPMFFLNQNRRDPKTDLGLYLFQCGHVIEPPEYPRLFSLIEKSLSQGRKKFQKIQSEIYPYVFEKGAEKRIRHVIFRSKT